MDAFSPELSHLVKNLAFSPTLSINEETRKRRANGEKVYAFGFGQAPFPASESAQSLLAKYAYDTTYAPTAGLLSLREAIASYYQTKFNLSFQPEQVVVGPGSKILLYATILSIAGDFLHIVPSWVSYAPQAQLAGQKIVPVYTRYQDRYLLEPNMLEKIVVEARGQGIDPTKCVLNYPNNPTGQTYSQSHLQELAEVFRKLKIVVLSDEIYGLLNYQESHHSLTHFYPQGTILTSGLSKDRSLGGYRLGLAVYPRELEHVRQTVKVIASETWSSAATPIQHVAISAFTNGHALDIEIAEHRRLYSMICVAFVRGLQKLGIKVHIPEGGFYCYPDFSKMEFVKAKGITDSSQLMKYFFDTAKIATLPGTAFGDQPSHLRLRLALVDFDGPRALEILQQDPDISPEQLLMRAAPVMFEALTAFEQCIRDIGKYL